MSMSYNGADAELWASLPEASGDDWERFRSAVVEVYPGVSEDRRYALADLEQLVEECLRFPVKSNVELGEFHRSFLRISNFLLKHGRLGCLQACRMYFGAFSGALRDQLDFRLGYRFLERHPDDPYAIADVYSAALFVLSRPLTPAAPTPVPPTPPPTPPLSTLPPTSTDPSAASPLFLLPPKTCLFCSDSDHLI